MLKFLSEFQNIIKEKNIKDYYGKKIAIDISILIYQFVIAVRSSGTDLINDKGDITSHLLGLFNKTLSFFEKGIIPVYVFDGTPPLLKQKTLNIRKQIRTKALEKLIDAKTDSDKIKYLKRSVKITRKQMDQCRELLDLMGIPYINAPEEADSELSYLCKENFVYAVLTEDMDILTFGSPRIIRNLTSNKKEPIEIELNDILEKLNITYDNFVELCILFGCDYCINIHDVKPLNIFNIYIKHKNIENTLNELKELGLISLDKMEYQEAKTYFVNSIHSNVTEENTRLKKPNIDKLIEFLVTKCGFIKSKIVYKVEKLNSYYNLFK